MDDAVAWWIAATLSATVSVVAWRAGSLRRDGAVAAALVGVLALQVSWGWGIFLIGWFVTASALSRVGRTRKAARTCDIVMKDDRRDAMQVLANGGVFAACALVAVAMRAFGADGHSPLAFAATLPATLPAALEATLAAAAAGSLAAAGADTWATEIGTLWGGSPWSLRDGRRVPAGTSGAVTLTGTLGGLCGALALSGLASVVGVIPPSGIAAVALGGAAGATADTVLGAWGQERRWCPRCASATERGVHVCGTATEHRGGVRRLDNDLVNAVCTLVGAIVSAIIATRWNGAT